jgi:hypothetical protein
MEDMDWVLEVYMKDTQNSQASSPLRVKVFSLKPWQGNISWFPSLIVLVSNYLNELIFN